MENKKIIIFFHILLQDDLIYTRYQNVAKTQHYGKQTIGWLLLKPGKETQKHTLEPLILDI